MQHTETSCGQTYACHVWKYARSQGGVMGDADGDEYGTPGELVAEACVGEAAMSSLKRLS